ncbi:hypothetical protein Q1695_012240 [Nippostrongylus brasiliensis]|nr:hypothetical protein Q1695_012240 [Nippostrongylus brasiliensis]
MDSSNGPPIYINEDIACIIIKHLSEEWDDADPGKSWIQARRVCRSFYKTVNRLLARTVSITVESAVSSTEVVHGFKSFDNELAYNNLVFLTTDSMGAFVRFLSNFVSDPVIVDLVNYDRGSIHDPLFPSFSMLNIKCIKLVEPYDCSCDDCRDIVSAIQNLAKYEERMIRGFSDSEGMDDDYHGYNGWEVDENWESDSLPDLSTPPFAFS